MNKKHRFPYEWRIADGYPAKGIEAHNSTVFGTFICGGGSSMGYKLAGYHHLGGVELDPKVADIYRANHNPEMLYNEDLRLFNQRTDLPSILYHLDLLDGSPPCFIAGTKVLTYTGYKNIEDVCEGDFVLTHKNRFMEVEKVMVKVAESRYRVTVGGLFDIEATPEHPFYVRTMKRNSSTQKRTFGEPGWKAVKDLEVKRNSSNAIMEQSFIGFCVNQDSKFPNWDGVLTRHVMPKSPTQLVKKFNLDMESDELWRLIGRYLGDGWLRDDRKEVIICCGKQDKDELAEIIAKAGFNACVSELRTSYRFTISSVELYAFLFQLGHGAENKHLTNDIISLPTEQLEAFFDGYLSADGHYDPRDDKWSCVSVSKELMIGMQMVVAKLYHQPSSVTVRGEHIDTIEGREVHAKESYKISFFKEQRKQQHFFYEDGYLWLPYRSKELINEQIEVYNLKVDTDESYTANNAIVHNCSTFSMAGSREGAWGKEKQFAEGQKLQTLDDLVFVYCDTILKLMPKCFLLENVKGLTAGNAKSYVKRVFNKLREGGYECQLFVCNAATMGVPQKRERAFIIGHKKEYLLPKLKLEFNEDPIYFREVIDKSDMKNNLTEGEQMHYNNRKPTDRTMSDTRKRIDGKSAGFTRSWVHGNDVCPTLTTTDMLVYDFPRKMNETEVRRCGSFPQDYKAPTRERLLWLCGMSVPPVMTANISYEIWRQWIKVIHEEEKGGE